LHAADARIRSLVLAPLNNELLGAIGAPKSSYLRIADQLDAIRAADGIAVAATAAADEEDASSTHPSLRARLKNVGVIDIPPLDFGPAPAAGVLLSVSAAKELTTRFDREWSRNAERRIGIY
jgi:hypothetical protein